MSNSYYENEGLHSFPFLVSLKILKKNNIILNKVVLFVFVLKRHITRIPLQ